MEAYVLMNPIAIWVANINDTGWLVIMKFRISTHRCSANPLGTVRNTSALLMVARRIMSQFIHCLDSNFKITMGFATARVQCEINALCYRRIARQNSGMMRNEFIVFHSNFEITALLLHRVETCGCPMITGTVQWYFQKWRTMGSMIFSLKNIIISMKTALHVHIMCIYIVH